MVADEFKGTLDSVYLQIKSYNLAGIYIHIPFCKQACHYCDFHFRTNTSTFEQMVESIGIEARLRADFLEKTPIHTLYFGGGSPSLARPEWIAQILDTIRVSFSLDLQEVTLEANPDDLSAEKLLAWKEMGIDRLSLGIQSFHDDVLRFFNRAHTAKESLRAIEISRDAGFDKFSMDLIYGVPHSDHSRWEKDLELAIAQQPGHLSCYALTIEPGTVLGNWAKKGKFQPAEEEFVAEQFEILQEHCERAGYDQYEISNFAQAGQESLHNSNYWRGLPYLGLGPGAHSFDGQNRGYNPPTNSGYLRSIQSGTIPQILDQMDATDRLNEYLLTALRTRWGVDLDWIQATYGKNIREDQAETLHNFAQAGWLIWTEKNLSLSKSGKLLADSIAQALFY